jgi:hypothetical protein
MLKKPELFERGYHLSFFPLPAEVSQFVRAEHWDELDGYFKKITAPGQQLYKYLQAYHDFSAIEFIISVRDAQNAWEEDGIWHDDGSRVFAFSLSLTLDSDHLKGGRLGIRRRGEEQSTEIPTPSFGGIILFLTGIYGYEHRIYQVKEGRRVIIAGWCS